MAKTRPAPCRSRLLLLLSGAGFTVLGRAWLVHLLLEAASGHMVTHAGQMQFAWSSAHPERFQAALAQNGRPPGAFDHPPR